MEGLDIQRNRKRVNRRESTDLPPTDIIDKVVGETAYRDADEKADLLLKEKRRTLENKSGQPPHVVVDDVLLSRLSEQTGELIKLRDNIKGRLGKLEKGHALASSGNVRLDNLKLNIVREELKRTSDIVASLLDYEELSQAEKKIKLGEYDPIKRVNQRFAEVLLAPLFESMGKEAKEAASNSIAQILDKNFGKLEKVELDGDEQNKVLDMARPIFLGRLKSLLDKSVDRKTKGEITKLGLEPLSIVREGAIKILKETFESPDFYVGIGVDGDIVAYSRSSDGKIIRYIVGSEPKGGAFSRFTNSKEFLLKKSQATVYLESAKRRILSLLGSVKIWAEGFLRKGREDVFERELPPAVTNYFAGPNADRRDPKHMESWAKRNIRDIVEKKLIVAENKREELSFRLAYAIRQQEAALLNDIRKGLIDEMVEDYFDAHLPFNFGLLNEPFSKALDEILKRRIKKYAELDYPGTATKWQKFSDKVFGSESKK